MSFKKLILKIHLWLGLSSGIIVVILGITGCLYAFEEELRPIIHSYYYVDQVKSKKLPVSQIIIIAKEANKAHPEQVMSGFDMFRDKKRTAAVYFYKELDEKAFWYWNLRSSTKVYVDPYTGKVEEIENQNTEFFVVVRMLHQFLFMRYEIGDIITGTATIIFIISLITGLILWWPKNKSAAKQRFWFRWKDTTKWKRKNYDIHNIMGFYFLIFALIIALTGLVWSFKWYDKGIQWALNGGKDSKKEVIESDTTQYTVHKPIDRIYAQINLLHPKAKRHYISNPTENDSLAPIYAFAGYDSSFDNVYINFDQYTGKLIKTSTYQDKDTGQKFRALNYGIHVGSILGFPGKILAFFASLVSASLPITGFLIWWGRRNKKQKK
ncbi:PepSY-associated TM helix domain-containing protein [Flavobacterium ajazii]|uniref:PepSY-associated TM helix domain-containing protein n=1 Tax=Flavobacterium ajazii TaxID=2692318 RepID=UPI0013D42719|nr:PepSY-associated TM helix domain-containing protein [Flavobacterium ajazii]